MNKIAVAVLVPALLVGGAAMNTSVLVVDVDAEDAPRMVFPVPLPVARAALAFAPDEARWIEAPDLAEHLPRVRRAIAALGDAPDGVLVEVEDGEEHVRVSKQGDVLRVRVTDGPGTDVDVDVPIASAGAALGAYDRERGSFRAAGLLAALGSVPDGDLVRVLDDSDEVQVSMW